MQIVSAELVRSERGQHTCAAIRELNNAENPWLLMPAGTRSRRSKPIAALVRSFESSDDTRWHISREVSVSCSSECRGR
jgi:hypothetical protein